MSDNIFWMVSDNFGDALNPYLYEKITGRASVNVEANSTDPHLMMIGSILNHANKNAIVWGCGLARLSDPVDPACDIRSVRGPISRQIAIDRGAKCPDVYGDPALLLPRFYPGTSTNENMLGVIPHVVDYAACRDSFSRYDGVKIIDLTQPIETVLDELLTCANVISSSLHGLIVADAYGIPSYWVEFSQNVLGDYTKFFDYFESVGIKKYHPVRLNSLEHFDFRLFEPVDMKVDLDLLLNAFPSEYVNNFVNRSDG